MYKIKLHKSVQITIIISVVALILASIIIGYVTAKSMTNTITVSGQAIEKVTPDLISVFFNVDTKGTTSKEAEDANSLIVNRLTDYIIALGFSKEDLTTDNYNIYPDYDYTTGKTSGYRATHSLKITFSVEDKAKVTSVIDAGTNAGAGISYINFELSPGLQQQYKTVAIKTASNDAKTKAEAVAEGFSKRLGKLVSVSLNEFNYMPWPIYASAGTAEDSARAKEAVTSITPSEQEVSAYVTAVYKLW